MEEQNLATVYSLNLHKWEVATCLENMNIRGPETLSPPADMQKYTQISRFRFPNLVLNSSRHL